MKKFFTLMLALLISASICVSALAAEDYTGTVTPGSVLLLNTDSGTILYSKDSSASVSPASTAKILTALILLEKSPDLDAVVTVGSDALQGITEGSDSTLTPMLSAGEEITVRQLLYGILLASGNDATAVAANYISGSEASFTELMNSTAAELGMTSTHFANSSGIASDELYTTCEDMAKLVTAAMKNSAFMEIAASESYTIPATNKSGERVIANSNLLLSKQSEYYYEYATGLKPGSSSSSGCLVATAEKDGAHLACLIFEDSSTDFNDRWSVAKDLFEYGFSQFKSVTLLDLIQPVTLPTDFTNADKYTVTPDFSQIAGNVTVDTTIDSLAVTAKVTPPADGKSGSGTIDYFLPDGTQLASVPAQFTLNKSIGGTIMKILLAIIIIILAVLAVAALGLAVLRGLNTRAHLAKAKRKTGRIFTASELFHQYFVTGVLALVVLIMILLIVLCTKQCGNIGADKSAAAVAVLNVTANL